MIYLDNAATTRMCTEAMDAMLPYCVQSYANPAAAYEFADESNKILEDGRDILSKMINCKNEEIYYISGGTEGDNFAIKKICDKYKKRGCHIIVSSIEHHAVIKTCEEMEKEGFEVTYATVDRYGRVNISQLEKSIRKDTILISVMHANNEVGTIQQIGTIGAIAKRHNCFFHVDAVQSFGHIPIDVKKMNIDILCASAHKFNGPKGVGFMYVRDGLELEALIHGGSQEKGIRAGTVNVSGVAGMIAAAKSNYRRMGYNIRYISRLRDYLIWRMTTEIKDVSLNGHREYRLPNNTSFYIKGIDSAVLLVMLDIRGICISTGSACSQGKNMPSHVIMAMFGDEDRARGTIRITLSEEITKEDIDYTVEVIKEEVRKLRMEGT